jgi:DNA primase
MSLSSLSTDMRQYITDIAHEEILNPNEGSRGFDYLKNRGIDKQTIIDWKLGYCPDHVKDLTFNDRILVPYHDPYGELLAVSVRKIEDDKPVWWNESFDKGKYLFGLDKAKRSIFDHNLAIIVEGQFDVISMHNHGLDMTVGLCGSSLDENQLTLLSRYCNRIILAFDVDENQTGQKASKKTFEFLKFRNLYIYKWIFPKGMDPDEYVRAYGAKKCKSDIRHIIKKFTLRDKKGLNEKYYFGEI